VWRVTQVGMLFNVLMTGALVALVYLFNRHSLGLFLGDDSVAIEIAQHINNVVLWSFILFGFTIVVFGAVRATGAVMAPLVILFVSMWLIRLPFAWLLGPHIGAESIWWSFPLGSVVSVLLAFGYYRYGNWRRSHILPVAPHPKRWGMHRTPAWACHARMPMRAREADAGVATTFLMHPDRFLNVWMRDI
jgi:Na+-driven multidrug efflux pump